jgi:FkbM family methyltransferase
MSTTVKQYWLKLLRAAGIYHFQGTNASGLRYVCHVGDFAGEIPFYSPRHSIEEIIVMAAWCRNTDAPVIFDVGANNGYIATQLAQLLTNQQPRIFAFEPVPSTFAHLKLSVEQLKLQDAVVPICCAVSDVPGIATLTFNPRESLFAQISENGPNPRGGRDIAWAGMITVDQIVASIKVVPTLLKIDVEGFETRVLRGAAYLINGPTPPGILVEWNPLTMSEVNASPADLVNILRDYAFYYVNDFEGQKRPFGERIDDLVNIDWVFNLFCAHADQSRKMLAVISESRAALNGAISERTAS